MSGNNVIVTGTGLEVPPVIGDLYASAIFQSGANGPFTLATGAPGILVTRLFITIDLLSTQGTAGNVVIQFNDVTSAKIFGQIAVFVPSAAPTKTAAQIGDNASSGFGFYYRPRVPNAVLQVQVASGGPLTAGSIRCAMNYALIAADT